MAVNTHAYARTLAHAHVNTCIYTPHHTYAHARTHTHAHTHCEVVDLSDDGPVEDQLGRVAFLPVQRARAALPNQLLDAAAPRQNVWPHLTEMTGSRNTRLQAGQTRAGGSSTNLVGLAAISRQLGRRAVQPRAREVRDSSLRPHPRCPPAEGARGRVR